MDGAKKIHQNMVLKDDDSNDNGGGRSHIQWMMKQTGSDVSESDQFTQSAEEDSSTSTASFSSSDSTIEEDTSSSASSSSHSNSPLFELSDLIAHLPMKRGLSNHYQGKSQSFASLASVKSLEDLAKKENPYRKRMKTCKSYGGSLNDHRYRPKATIAKKASRDSKPSSFGKSCSRPAFAMIGNF